MVTRSLWPLALTLSTQKLQQPIGVEGFLEEVDRPGPHRPHCERHLMAPRDDHNRKIEAIRLQSLVNQQPAHPRQSDVEHHAPLPGLGAECLQEQLGGREVLYLMTSGPKQSGSMLAAPVFRRRNRGPPGCRTFAAAADALTEAFAFEGRLATQAEPFGRHVPVRPRRGCHVKIRIVHGLLSWNSLTDPGGTVSGLGLEDRVPDAKTVWF